VPPSPVTCVFIELIYVNSTSQPPTLCAQDRYPPELRYKPTSMPDHCKYKYLLNLAGNAASSRFKYLFMCNSTVISPVRSGGFGGAGPGNGRSAQYANCA